MECEWKLAVILRTVETMLALLLNTSISPSAPPIAVAYVTIPFL